MMHETHPDWDTVVIISKVNQYYFTGTMQDGLLVIKSDGEARYFARRSFERAREESPLNTIYPMESYRDAAQVIGSDLGDTFLETEIVTLGMLERLKKYFNMRTISSLDRVALSVRSIKTLYELKWMEASGKRHHEFLRNIGSYPSSGRHNVRRILWPKCLRKWLNRGTKASAGFCHVPDGNGGGPDRFWRKLHLSHQF